MSETEIDLDIYTEIDTEKKRSEKKLNKDHTLINVWIERGRLVDTH